MRLKHLALVVTGLFALTSCGGSSGGKSGLPSDALPTVETSSNPTADANAIAYNDMAVHDPSIIKGDDGQYYVFGSHLAAAKSKDLMKWDVVANGIDDAHPIDSNPLFNTYSSQITNGIAWTDGYKGSWAADVIKAPNGKYWFYYNHCAQSEANGGCWNRSYLGLAESSSITGPYVDKGILLRSGYRNAGEFTSFPLDNGQKKYDGAVDPNAIDPHVFYDKTGGLWMVYGSYSGGIFVLELDAATGKAKAGQGYGTHVAGGVFAPIEGSWMIYSPETDYYYMFNSIGGFDAAGGYNIRVSRSKSPKGPFLDSAGNDMLNAKINVDTLSKYGVKLMGGFNFVADVGDTSSGWGYLSPGHNSVYYDATTKKYFLVTHTRFPNRGEEHSVRVHELWLNSDAWFVASPQRYAPISGTNVVDANDVVGTYRFVSHFRDTNTTGHDSIYINLNSDKSISGEVTGYYALSSTDKTRIDIVITDDNYKKIYTGKYSGVLQWQWDAATKKLAPAFSALQLDGTTIWGSHVDSKTTAQALTSVLDAISIPSEITATSLTVPLRGTHAAKITWTSSAPPVINLKRNKKTGLLTGTARVNRPSQSAGDQTVVLTATATLDGQTQSRTYTTKVMALRFIAATANYDFEDSLVDSKSNFPAATATGDRIFNTGTVSYVDGVDGRAVNLQGASGVRLPNGLISNYKYTVSYWLRPQAKTWFTSSFFAGVNWGNNFEWDWISFPLETWWDQTFKIWTISNTVAVGDTWCATGVALDLNQWTKVTVSVNSGTAIVYINDVPKCTALGVADLFSRNTGGFALGVNPWDVPFVGQIDNFQVWNQVLTPEQLTVLDPAGKTADEVLAAARAELTLGNLSEITTDIDLPLAGQYTAAISWKSSNTAFMDDVGNVTRPAAGQPDATLTLTATLSFGGKSVTKAFNVTVKALVLANPVAVFSFDNNLTDAKGHGTGTTTGNRVNLEGGAISYTSGISGSAVVFDGNSGVLLPDNLVKDTDYSISVWLKPSAFTQYTPALFAWFDTGNWISVAPFGPGAGDTMLWTGGAPDWFDATVGSQISKGAWTHLVFARDSNNVVKTYVNGVLTRTHSGHPDNLSSTLTHWALAVNYWDIPYAGAMDELKIYDEAVTQADVDVLYAEKQ